MAGIYVRLPDELADKAARRGLLTNEVFERALRRELIAVSDSETGSRADDDSSYMEGYELGVRWAGEARFDEISEVAKWREVAWRQFSLDVDAHSLPEAICAAQGVEPPAQSTFWVERTPFTEGVLDAIGELWLAASA